MQPPTDICTCSFNFQCHVIIHTILTSEPKKYGQINYSARIATSDILKVCQTGGTTTNITDINNERGNQDPKVQQFNECFYFDI
jgi:hypothetical protein